MSVQSRAVLKTWFETGDLPTQEQYRDLIESLLHVTEDKPLLGLKKHSTTRPYKADECAVVEGRIHMALVDTQGAFDEVKWFDLSQVLASYVGYPDYENDEIYNDTDNSKVTYQFRLFKCVVESSEGVAPLNVDGSVNANWEEVSANSGDGFGSKWIAGVYNQDDVRRHNGFLYELQEEDGFESVDIDLEISEEKWVRLLYAIQDLAYGEAWNGVTNAGASLNVLRAAFLSQLAEAKAYAEGLVVGLWDDRGNYDASGDVFPSIGGSGAAGAILKGDIWTVLVAGELNGIEVEPGDTVRALIDSPGQTGSNWAIAENNLGYVPENSANKSSDVNADQASTTKYATVKAIYDWAVALFQTLANKATDFSVINDTKYPTTEAVDENFSYRNLTINNQTDSYTAVLADAKDKLIELDKATALNFTVPPNGDVAFPIGAILIIEQTGVGQVTVVAGSGVTINSADSYLKLRVKNSSAYLLKKATNTWSLVGDLTS
jgi:hypothetical protein